MGRCHTWKRGATYTECFRVSGIIRVKTWTPPGMPILGGCRPVRCCHFCEAPMERLALPSLRHGQASHLLRPALPVILLTWEVFLDRPASGDFLTMPSKNLRSLHILCSFALFLVSSSQLASSGELLTNTRLLSEPKRDATQEFYCQVHIFPTLCEAR